MADALGFDTGVLLANRFTGATCVGCWTRGARVGILNMNKILLILFEKNTLVFYRGGLATWNFWLACMILILR